MPDVRLPHPFVGFAVGLGVGASLGILFAPKSGEETREHVAEGTRGAIDDVADASRRFKTRATQAANDAAEHMMHATDAGKQAYTRAKGA